MARGQLDELPDDAATCCACGRTTADIVIGESFSVVARHGGRQLAPPIPLCENCRRDVIYKRGWLPTWCTECEGWRTLGHDHGNLIALRAEPAEISDPEPILHVVGT